MKTTKPFSTISYNSTDFLLVKLNDLIQRNVLEWWCFIEHFHEEDEEKDHKHVFFKPNGQMQTDTLKTYLQEFDPTHPDKPLGILPIGSSRWDDWFLYALHDEAYLATKGQSRKYSYTLDDIKTSNRDYLVHMSHMVNRAAYRKTQDLIDKFMSGQDINSVLASGQVALPHIAQAIKLYEYIVGGVTYRNDRDGHEVAISNLEAIEECRDMRTYGQMPKLRK